MFADARCDPHGARWNGAPSLARARGRGNATGAGRASGLSASVSASHSATSGRKLKEVFALCEVSGTPETAEAEPVEQASGEPAARTRARSDGRRGTARTEALAGFQGEESSSTSAPTSVTVSIGTPPSAMEISILFSETDWK
jgi:hypothetical protein